MNFAGGCYTRPLTLTFLAAAEKIWEVKALLATFVALLELTDRNPLKLGFSRKHNAVQMCSLSSLVTLVSIFSET